VSERKKNGNANGNGYKYRTQLECFLAWLAGASIRELVRNSRWGKDKLRRWINEEWKPKLAARMEQTLDRVTESLANALVAGNEATQRLLANAVFPVDNHEAFVKLFAQVIDEASRLSGGNGNGAGAAAGPIVQQVTRSLDSENTDDADGDD